MAVLMEFVIKVKDDLNRPASSFNDFRVVNISYAMVYDQSLESDPFLQKLKNATRDQIYLDTGKEPNYLYFHNISEMNKKVYDTMSSVDMNIAIGYAIDSSLTSNFIPLTLLYNDTKITGNPGLGKSLEQMHRAIWTALGLGSFDLRSIPLVSKYASLSIVRQSGMFILYALLSVCNFFVTPAIEDIKKEKRAYMRSCKLSLFKYWLGCFIVDYLLWALSSVAVWAAFILMKSAAFENHKYIYLYGLLVNGISITLATYCLCFLFDDPDSGTTYLMLLQELPIFIAISIFEAFSEEGKRKKAWILSAYPPTNVYEFFVYLVSFNGNFADLWSDSKAQPYMFMMIANIPLYCLILWLIEKSSESSAIRNAESSFQEYHELFQKIKARHHITTESLQEEERISQSDPSDYAIRISNVCKIYFDTLENPIPAVNYVSLGVKKGELYGFLGANGAGKTTLMKMMTGIIPMSFGDIHINGESIKESTKPLLALCPQFNTHLTDELTILEHIDLFGSLFELSQGEIDSAKNEMIPMLGLEEHQNKIIKELSGGNARKLAIIIAFMAPTDVILLDEPTSSLDPVSRRKVHDLISHYKGKKTFLLCTHLLDEAELLCEKISMMINGCIFTIGTPQYLSGKFGTEWRLDIQLEDDSPDTITKVNHFIEKNIPESKLTIKRMLNMLYSVPSSSTRLSSLFRMLKDNQASVGIKSFTCSSSTLEKVFLELIVLADQLAKVEESTDEEVNLVV